MIDSSATITEFLQAAAAKQPTPGGGAVAALAGALAGSMGEMVLAYSVGKKDLAPHAAANQQAMKELEIAQDTLLRLMVEDQLAFGTLTEAKKAGLPDAQIDRLVESCTRIPLATGAAALEILEIANRIALTSNQWLLSDLAVCGELAMATVRCAHHNVLVNLPGISDEKLRQTLHDAATEQVRRGIERISRLIPSIRAIQGNP